MNLLSQATDTYIPVAPFLLEVSLKLYREGARDVAFVSLAAATHEVYEKEKKEKERRERRKKINGQAYLKRAVKPCACTC